METIVTALKPYRNWYLDLANERNIRDPRFTSFAELKELRDLVKRLDPKRLATASHNGAKAGGAAGWCFHNGDQKGEPEGRPRRSFDMRERRDRP